MPELPEVHTVVLSLQPALTGRKIGRVHLLRADIVEPRDINLTLSLAGQTIRAIFRRGKKIVFELNRGERFYIHLGMTGRLVVEPKTAPQPPHTHLILEFPNLRLRFTDPRRFGGLFWLGKDGSPDTGLGPEPLEARPAQFHADLSKTRRAIKTALLDQTLLAGVGNIYADEALFDANIHPQTPAHHLTRAQAASLLTSIKKVLRRAMRHRGSTLRDYRDANGNPGEFQKLHKVYAREGQPCPNCGTPIQRLVLTARSAHFCPQCQPPHSKNLHLPPL